MWGVGIQRVIISIYEGIEVQNMAVQIIAYDEEQMTVRNCQKITFNFGA